MSDTARETNDYQTIEPSSIEGLEQLFAPAREDLQERLLEEVRDASEPLLEGVPLSAAARMLGVHRRYALDLLHKNKLAGFKNQKGQWLITLDSIETRKQHLIQPCTDAESRIPLKPVEPLSGGGLDVLQEEFVEGVELIQEPLHEDLIQATAGPFDGQIIQSLLAEMQKKLDANEHHLQAANYRIGYLEAQLENERQQVKLLTDSQHKPGWWARFSSWFFKGR